jgi:rubrerythrin
MAAETPFEYAIQLEQDGQRYYSEAAEGTSNPLGKQMFQSLAADENRHEQIIRRMADKMAVELPEDLPKRRLVTLFSTLGDELKQDLTADADDSQVIAKAIEMEKASEALYREQASETDSQDEEAIWERLALEESQHTDILRNTQTYLDDTGHWFLWDEGSLLDGG